MNELTLKSATPAIETAANQSQHFRNSHHGASLLEQVLSALIKSLKDYRIPRSPAPAQRGFIEENLLDPNIGPEIHRTLR